MICQWKSAVISVGLIHCFCNLNQLQDKLRLKELVSLNDFRCILKDLVLESPDCKCFE